MRRAPASNAAMRVTPRPSLLQGGTASFLVISIVLFGALYALSTPLGRWPTVLAIHVGVTIGFVTALIRYRVTHVLVANGLLEYHGFLRPKWSVPVETIASVDMVNIYLSNATETSPQLLLRDATGKRILRMRGLFWRESDMRAITDAIGNTVDTRETPLTTKEFIAEYPGSAFWFEAKPALMVGLGIGIAVVGLGAVTVLMMLTGIRFNGA